MTGKTLWHVISAGMYRRYAAYTSAFFAGKMSMLSRSFTGVHRIAHNIAAGYGMYDTRVNERSDGPENSSPVKIECQFFPQFLFRKGGIASCQCIQHIHSAGRFCQPRPVKYFYAFHKCVICVFATMLQK